LLGRYSQSTPKSSLLKSCDDPFSQKSPLAKYTTKDEAH
jgi:hypothetical protein